MGDDVHQHRRQGDNDQDETRMERVAHSAATKVVTAGAVALIPILLGVIAWFGGDALKDIQTTQEEQGKTIQQIKSDVRDVNTRLDAQVIRQVDNNSRQIIDIEDRVQVLERSVPLP